MLRKLYKDFTNKYREEDEELDLPVGEEEGEVKSVEP